MADEPRRSGRATKGQHTNKPASSSPAPSLPKTTKSAKSKASKKSSEPTPTPSEVQGEDDEGDEVRCICGNNNPSDKRAFIGCDDCGVWQHNICMGIAEDEDDIPSGYACEECSPEDHRETLQAMARGERIWEVRSKIHANEKKAGRNRKGKKEPGWLKKDVPVEEGTIEESTEQGAGSKRKRANDEAGKVQDEEQERTVKDEAEDEDEKPSRLARQDKRRKSAAPSTVDPETDIVSLEQLPLDRQKIVTALSKIIADDITSRSKAGAYRIPDGHTAKSLGEYYALRIEYSLKMNHGETTSEGYRTQFRTLNANMKKNKMLIEQLLKKSLTPDELSTMSSSDMASEELQKERAAMKEQLDRQAIVTETEGPRYRRTHKGDELIEDENLQMVGQSNTTAQPVRERTSLADADMMDADVSSRALDGAASPRRTGSQAAPPLTVNTRGESSAGMNERRQSSQQFDMNSIWGKSAQSPTSASAIAPRPMQMPPRRRSSIPQQQQEGGGTKVDADVDRMLEDDDDEAYSPAEYTDPDAIVWRGKLVQSTDSGSPTVRARWVAGRDIISTVSWDRLLPDHLNIDGRLAIEKAEDYLCSLQYSSSSDVSVLAFTPSDDSDAEGFDAFYNYFRSRQRYAVVKEDKPAMVKDLYIIPFEPGESPPPHVGMLEVNHILEKPLQQKCLLATFVIGRAPGTPPVNQQQGGAVPASGTAAPSTGANGQQVLPQHMRAATQGPAGSPMNPSNATFSPSTANNAGFQQQAAGYGAGIPPNPYTPTPTGAHGQAPPPTWPQQPQQPYSGPPLQGIPQYANPLIYEILGPLLDCPTAQAVVNTDPNIGRDKLTHLRQILEEDESTRTDIERLGKRLGAMA